MEEEEAGAEEGMQVNKIIRNSRNWKRINKINNRNGSRIGTRQNRVTIGTEKRVNDNGEKVGRGRE